jgi:hypothetical protein
MHSAAAPVMQHTCYYHGRAQSQMRSRRGVLLTARCACKRRRDYAVDRMGMPISKAHTACSSIPCGRDLSYTHDAVIGGCALAGRCQAKDLAPDDLGTLTHRPHASVVLAQLARSIRTARAALSRAATEFTVGICRLHCQLHQGMYL